jgi:prophage regulatory protein
MMSQDPPAGVPVRAKPRAARSQPLSVVDVDGGLLTLETVMDLTGLRKSQVYALIRSGQFPESVKVSKRSVRWRAEELRVWMTRRGRV